MAKQRRIVPLKAGTLIRQTQVAPLVSQEQAMLSSLFGGGDKVIFGNPESQCFPRVDHILSSGNGLIKSGDDEGETSSLFGF